MRLASFPYYFGSVSLDNTQHLTVLSRLQMKLHSLPYNLLIIEIIVG